MRLLAAQPMENAGDDQMQTSDTAAAAIEATASDDQPQASIDPALTLVRMSDLLEPVAPNIADILRSLYARLSSQISLDDPMDLQLLLAGTPHIPATQFPLQRPVAPAPVAAPAKQSRFSAMLRK